MLENIRERLQRNICEVFLDKQMLGSKNPYGSICRRIFFGVSIDTAMRVQVFENHSQLFDIRTYLGVLTLWLWKGETLTNLRKHLVQSIDLACFRRRETDRKQGYYKNIIRREWMDEKFYLSILASARESIENGIGSRVGKKNREKRHSSKRVR